MTDLEGSWEQFKAIILNACHILKEAEKNARQRPPGDVYEPGVDCYVLLHDATRVFCQAVSTYYGQSLERRWNPELPFFLLTHPERCPEALALLEKEDYRESVCMKLVEA